MNVRIISHYYKKIFAVAHAATEPKILWVSRSGMEKSLESWAGTNVRSVINTVREEVFKLPIRKNYSVIPWTYSS